MKNTVQDLIDRLNELPDKTKPIRPVWLPEKEHHFFTINNVEDDIDTVLIWIENID